MSKDNLFREGGLEQKPPPEVLEFSSAHLNLANALDQNRRDWRSKPVIQAVNAALDLVDERALRSYKKMLPGLTHRAHMIFIQATTGFDSLLNSVGTHGPDNALELKERIADLADLIVRSDPELDEQARELEKKSKREERQRKGFLGSLRGRR
jgi:hypothetical protein